MSEEISVEVIIGLKDEVGDPLGRAQCGQLHALGFGEVKQVRAGKFIEIRLLAASRKEAEARVREMCKKLLANPLIERFEIVNDPPPREWKSWKGRIL